MYGYTRRGWSVCPEKNVQLESFEERELVLLNNSRLKLFLRKLESRFTRQCTVIIAFP